MKVLQMRDNIEVFLYKDTKDSDLKVGQLVCYQNTFGVYANLGVITDITIADNTKNYLINTSFVAYVASELKLTKTKKNNN
jgi:hypothetical protein